jgi:hypothetical protein
VETLIACICFVWSPSILAVDQHISVAVLNWAWSQAMGVVFQLGYLITKFVFNNIFRQHTIPTGTHKPLG